jgi:hypothetical protein
MSSSDFLQRVPYPPSFSEPAADVECRDLYEALHDAEILNVLEDREHSEVVLDMRLGEPKMTDEAPSRLKLHFHGVLVASLSLNPEVVGPMWAEPLNRLNGDIEYRDVIWANLLSNEGGHTLRLTSGYFKLMISARSISWIVDGQDIGLDALLEKCTKQWELWSQRKHGEK